MTTRTEAKSKAVSKAKAPTLPQAGRIGHPGKAKATNTTFEAGPSLRFPSFRQGKRDDNEKLDGASRCFFFCAVV